MSKEYTDLYGKGDAAVELVWGHRALIHHRVAYASRIAWYMRSVKPSPDVTSRMRIRSLLVDAVGITVVIAVWVIGYCIVT